MSNLSLIKQGFKGATPVACTWLNEIQPFLLSQFMYIQNEDNRREYLMKVADLDKVRTTAARLREQNNTLLNVLSKVMEGKEEQYPQEMKVLIDLATKYKED